MADRNNHLVYVIAGPTASGKSGLALALAERLGGVVINADSMQVYKGIEVLTDQPEAEARERVPHRLYGVLDPGESCSAGRWRGLALDEIHKALDNGLVPVVVGGSGLYLKALLEGIAPVPEIPSDIREAVRCRHEILGNRAFHDELRQRDPVMAGRTSASDSQRMIRAAEVLEATGRSLVDWHGEPTDGPPEDMVFRTILLMPPRQALYAAIDARFDAMVEAGAMDEANALAARGLSPDLPVMKALGIAELVAVTKGEADMAAALGRAKTATRNYAKRQITWFKSQIITDLVIKLKFSERNIEKILSDII
jgi:tRNA dimethylallyltransferase